MTSDQIHNLEIWSRSQTSLTRIINRRVFRIIHKKLLLNLDNTRAFFYKQKKNYPVLI